MANKKTLEELAYEFVVLRHKNDKSGGQLARMNRRFGRKAADEAIANARKVLALIDPDNPRAKEPKSRTHSVDWKIPPRTVHGKRDMQAFFNAFASMDERSKQAFTDMYTAQFESIMKKTREQSKDALLYGTGVMPKPDKPAYGGFDLASIRKDISWRIPPKLFQPEKTISSSSALTSLAFTELELPDMPTSTEEPSGTKE